MSLISFIPIFFIWLRGIQDENKEWLKLKKDDGESDEDEEESEEEKDEESGEEEESDVEMVCFS